MKIRVPPRKDFNQGYTIDIEPLKVEFVDWSSSVNMYKLTEEQRKYVLDKAAEQFMENVALLETSARITAGAVSTMADVFDIDMEIDDED